VRKVWLWWRKGFLCRATAASLGEIKNGVEHSRKNLKQKREGRDAGIEEFQPGVRNP